MNKLYVTVVVFFLVVAGRTSVGDESSLEEMRIRCEEARERRIAPLRDEAIEKCVSAPRTTRAREDCERIYSDFGEAGGTAARGLRPTLFHDLPECVEYAGALERVRNTGSPR